MAGQDVDWGEVQGIVLSSYSKKPFGRYFLLTIEDIQATRKWLRHELSKDRTRISFGDDRSVWGMSLNIAFTLSGLDKLGLTKDDLNTFPWDFRDGMTSPLRSRILADRDHNNPSNWDWGFKKGNIPDVLVLMYAGTENSCAKLAAALQRCWGTALKEIEHGNPKDGYRPADLCEHFGFADGLSQPAIETSPRSRKFQERGDFDAIVRSGEFILGYVNERGQLPVSPTVAMARGTKLAVITYADRSLSRQSLPDEPPEPSTFHTRLAKIPNNTWHRLTGILKRGLPDQNWMRIFARTRNPLKIDLEQPRLDFGRNGTFLVYRQLEQDVFAFDKLIKDAADALGDEKTPRLSDEAGFRELLAAKIMGRWADGTPLTLEPKKPPPQGGNLKAVNNFGYGDEDAHGLRCPLGAHIRRANPRDTLGNDPKFSMRRNNRHRLLRRGRLYGRQTDWKAWDEKKRSGQGIKRGLHFIAINASLESQFEFIQQTWMNTPFFGGLTNEHDPLVGVPEGKSRRFTIQSAPVNRRIQWDTPLVTVRGGAYFFLPSKAALDFLATDDPDK